MISIATKAPAYETAIDDVMPEVQQIFDTSADKPQHTPKEVAALYPNIAKDNYRQALLRVANKQKADPRAKHLSKLMNFVSRIRTTFDHYDCLDYLREIFPDEPIRQLNTYLVDILTLWCLPFRSKDDAAQALLDDASGSDYLREIIENYATTTPEWLEQKGKEFIKLKSELAKKMSGTTLEDEYDAIDEALSGIEAIQLILEGNYYGLWHVFAEAGWRSQPAAIASLIVEYMRLYYKK